MEGETCFTASGTENLRPCMETVVTGLQMLAEEFPEYVDFLISSPDSNVSEYP